MDIPSTPSRPDGIDGSEEKDQDITTNVLSANSYRRDPEKRSTYGSEPESEENVEVIRKAEDVSILVHLREYSLIRNILICTAGRFSQRKTILPYLSSLTEQSFLV